MSRALVGLVGLVALGGVASAETVTGTVRDRASGAPIAGATVVIGSELAATSDDGSFTLAVPPGAYAIEVSADWLVRTTRRIAVARGATVSVVIDVDPAAVPAGETIEVRDLAPTAPGETKVDAAFARTLPGGGDAAKVVQSLPAVARPSAGSTDIVVWGAAPHDTRVFVDGVPVLALYHVGGYRSAVGNDLIGDIHLTPAAFGVDRGGAIGGVIDIGMADPSTMPAWRVQADVLDGSAMGKVQLGELVIAAAIRQSWLDRAIGVIEDPRQLAPNVPLPRWTDGQIVARAPLGDGVVLTAWLLGSLDHLERTLYSDDPATQTDEQLDSSSLRGQVTLRRDHPAGYESATLWFGRDATTDNFQFGLIPADDAQRTWSLGGRAVQQTRLSQVATLTLGSDVDSEFATLSRLGSLTIPAREGDLHIFGQPPGDDINADHWQATTVDAAGHVALDLRFGRVTATLGLRADEWLLTASRLTPRVSTTPGIGSQQQFDTEDPRASVQVRITDELVARADGGRYHEAREASDTSAVFGTPGLGVEEAWHAVVGAQWRRAPLAIEVAGYARWLDDLVARDLDVTPPLAGVLTQDGIGTVFGVQTTARVLDWHGLSGWLSYNLSRSRRKDAESQAWRLFDHDQTHGLIAVAGWEHGPWSLGGRVRVATGEPRTDVTGAFYDVRDGRYEPIVGPHNGVRLPTFFAADLRGERRLRLPGAHAALYVEIQNLTDRANAEEIIYNADFSQRGYLTSLPLLAIAGVRIQQ